MAPSSFSSWRIGTAGWALPAKSRAAFSEGANNLARYATRLRCAEINSSFYRAHKPETYAGWAAQTPDDFAFSVKLPRTITQYQRLKDCDSLIAQFAEESAGLGAKRQVVLAQLPPSLVFDADIAQPFFAQLARAVDCAIACEPRHASWGSDAAEALLADLGVARVAADPPRFARDATPGGTDRLVYYRLHGSPRIYYGNYDDGRIEKLAETLPLDRSCWVIFDNTASGAATANALSLIDLESEMREKAAVDSQDLTRDIASRIRGQEDRRACYFIGPAPPS